jgi:hypothetical protein
VAVEALVLGVASGVDDALAESVADDDVADTDGAAVAWDVHPARARTAATANRFRFTGTTVAAVGAVATKEPQRCPLGLFPMVLSEGGAPYTSRTRTSWNYL